jgi:hypothetical protein
MLNCDIMYIQQSIPQITIHLSYIDTLQQVNCDIMYIQQNTPQITIHMLYIDSLQYFNYFKSHIYHPLYVCCDRFSLVVLYIYSYINLDSVVYTLYHNTPGVRCLYITSGMWFVVYSVVYTLYHNPPVVRCLYTSGIWFVVYSVVYNIDTLQQVDCDIMYIQQNTPQITIHLMYIDTLQQVDCNIMYNNKLLI